MITNTSSIQIKHIRKLRQRQEREETGLFFIEGLRLVIEAIQLREPIDKLIFAPELLKSELGQQTVQHQLDLGARGIPCVEVSAEVFKSLSAKEGPQGLGAVIRQHWEPLDRVKILQNEYWIALDAAQDPGNIGTILRTADSFGCSGLILVGNCADPYDPTALRASMGAIFAQRLVKASVTDFLTWRQACLHISVVGTSDAAPQDFRSTTYRTPLILFMGSERQGLAPELKATCDTLVKIPMVGRSDSLNLAIATGITLYEIFHQCREG